MVAGVVLAAGAATRFGGPKQTLLVGDVVAALGRSSVDGIVVVTGAHALEATAPLVRCPDWGAAQAPACAAGWPRSRTASTRRSSRSRTGGPSRPPLSTA
jgi:CTP:molybdopterin cytidylyltransferase MocA